jgi:hypothetical protein
MGNHVRLWMTLSLLLFVTSSLKPSQALTSGCVNRYDEVGLDDSNCLSSQCTALCTQTGGGGGGIGIIQSRSMSQPMRGVAILAGLRLYDRRSLNRVGTTRLCDPIQMHSILERFAQADFPKLSRCFLPSIAREQGALS